MKLTADEYKKYVKDEYIRAYTQYQAMILLAKQQGVDTDDVPTPTPTPDPEPKPTPTPAPDPEPTPEPTPISADPEIIYDGASTITLARGERYKFSVYVNNVNSSSDYIINTSGEPVYYKCDETGYKTSNGFRLDFNLTGVNFGGGGIKVYLAKDKTKNAVIAVKVK